MKNKLKNLLKNFILSILTTITWVAIAIWWIAYAYTTATDSWKLTAAMWNELMDAVTSNWNWAPALWTDSLNAQMDFSLHEDNCTSWWVFVPIKSATEWICMEAEERTAKHWEDASKTCSDLWWRLPEPREWKFACQSAATYWLNNMTWNWEWSSNFAQPLYYGSNLGVGAALAGTAGCHYADWGWVGYNTGHEGSAVFRCVR
jgi:hypothetical protein